MSDLIDRGALLDELVEELEWEIEHPESSAAACAFRISIKMVKNAQTVDAEPVRRGEWIGKYGYISCSNCGACGYALWKRCPNCGAKMDGGKENEK